MPWEKDDYSKNSLSPWERVRVREARNGRRTDHANNRIGSCEYLFYINLFYINLEKLNIK